MEMEKKYNIMERKKNITLWKWKKEEKINW